MIGTRGGRLDWRASTLFVGGKHARPGGNWTVVPAARSYTVPDGGLAIPTLGSLPSPLTRTDDADDALWCWLAGGLVWRQRAVDRQAQGARELLSYLASPDGARLHQQTGVASIGSSGAGRTRRGDLWTPPRYPTGERATARTARRGTRSEEGSRSPVHHDVHATERPQWCRNEYGRCQVARMRSIPCHAAAMTVGL
jgi:hypothetical protein